jgi:hypothetical protein
MVLRYFLHFRIPAAFGSSNHLLLVTLT